MFSVLKGRVHGLAHAHESNCCFFFSPVYAVVSTQAILFHDIVKEPTRSKEIARVGNFLTKVSRLMISQPSARAPGSHLTKARANSGKIINHGIKPSGQQ